MDQFEYEGLWWLPENPVYKISGTLKFHPIEGAYLELIGAFKKFIDFKTLLEPKIILGNTSNGIITLYDCFENRSSFAGLFTSSFYVNVIFKGHHFEKEEDIIFNNLSINYSHLEEWTKISGFKIYPDTDEKNVNIFYTYPQKVEAKLENLNISFDYDFSLNMKGIEELNLKQTIFIKMEPDKSIHYNEFQNNICYHIQNFLSLAIGRAIHPLIITGENAACKKKLLDGSVKFKKISIFYSMNHLPDSSKQTNHLEMLFLFEDISDNFEKCLNNWIKKSELLKPVYDLYFGTLYNPSMYIEHEFLSLIQAIESYHRRVHDGKYVSKDDYKKIYDKLINAIADLPNDDFKEILKAKLHSLNEFTLRTRLELIFMKCNSLASFTKSLIPDEKKFIKDVVNTRNFLTHYDKKKKNETKTWEEFDNLVKKMKFLIEICFLIEIEISKENIETLVSRNQRYKPV